MLFLVIISNKFNALEISWKAPAHFSTQRKRLAKLLFSNYRDIDIDINNQEKLIGVKSGSTLTSVSSSRRCS